MSLPTRSWMGRVLGIGAIILIPVLVSCVSTTGTKTNLTTDELARIRKAGVTVESHQPLSVRMARDKLTATGVAVGSIFGVVGAVVGAAVTAAEASSKSSKDAEHADVVGRILEFDPTKEHAAAFRDALMEAHAFPVVEIVQAEDRQSLRTQGFDAVFKETIEEWGLRLCLGEDNVRVVFDVHMQLWSLQKNTMLWERNDLFIDGPCRPLREFQDDRNLLNASFRSATQTLARKTANEIAFP